MNNKTKSNTQVKIAARPASKELRDLAKEVRKYAFEIEKEKMVKCAKYIVGLTSLVQLRNKLRSL